MGNEIYELKDKYYLLDEEGKYLIDEIIRFCNDKGKFPNEKELSNKNGYPVRTKIYKYFNTSSFTVVYDYVSPVREEKPDVLVCNCCGIEKPFNRNHFGEHKMAKFQLKKICIKCESEKTRIRNYNKKGININNIYDLDIYEWHELMYKNKIATMPPEMYTDGNCIKVIRKLILTSTNSVIDKELILEVFDVKFQKKYKIKEWIYVLGNKIECLNRCFPELRFEESDMDKYKDEDFFEILEKNIIHQGVSVSDILNGNFNMRNNKELRNLSSLLLNRNIGTNEFYVKYFKHKNIKHPITNGDIGVYDFNNKPCGFFDDKSNIIGVIKRYCEDICEINILDVINDNDKLRKWIRKNFTQSKASSIMCYDHYFDSLYDALVFAYPEIKDNNILFNWEWTQCNNSSRDFLIKALRELVEYRICNIAGYKDIPKYVNRGYMSNNYPKFVRHIDRNRFESFYEWTCLSFPEYADLWSKDDFSIIESLDGNVFTSYQERDVYEYIKKNDIFSNIMPIGRNRVGKYIFKLESDNYSMYCPDFVIEYVNIDNVPVKLEKPIILEYYGMYDEKNKNEIFVNYRKKTKAKEEYYKNNKDIYYIGIYPKDIRNNFKGLAKLLDLFYIENNLYKLAS